MATVLWKRELPYRSTRVRVERLPKGWRVTLGSLGSIERRSLIDAFEALLGRSVRNEELSIVLTVLDSRGSDAAAADAPVTRELRSLNLK